MCLLGSYIYKRARNSFHKIGFHLDATLDQESKFPMTKKRGNRRSCLNCTRSAFLPAFLAISNVSSIWARIRGYSKLFTHRLHLFFTLVGFSLFSPRWIVLKLAAWLLSHIEGEEKSPHTLCKGEVARLEIRFWQHLWKANIGIHLHNAQYSMYVVHTTLHNVQHLNMMDIHLNVTPMEYSTQNQEYCYCKTHQSWVKYSSRLSEAARISRFHDWSPLHEWEACLSRDVQQDDRCSASDAYLSSVIDLPEKDGSLSLLWFLPLSPRSFSGLQKLRLLSNKSNLSHHCTS